MHNPSILVLSLSNIASDARVLRQIGIASEFGRVTTVGYGQTPPGADEHIRISDTASSLPQTIPGVFKLATRQLKSAELAAPGVQEILRKLQNRSFDVVIANEARILACAFKVAGDSPVWVDLHEYAPEERTHILSWKLLVAPLMHHLCKKYLPRTSASTTVSAGIADLYAEVYGVRPQLMRNMASFQDLTPSETEQSHIRLVHSGGAVQGRNIEAMIDAVKALPDTFSLDLYLIPGNDGGSYIRSLKERARGCTKITFHPPVSPHELPHTLNQYDVGVYWMPPAHTNARLALPNKVFDFIQARLALAIGPTLEMAKIVNEHELGVVSEDFSLESIKASLSSLNREKIEQFKHNSNQVAYDLSFENEAEVERGILRSLISKE